MAFPEGYEFQWHDLRAQCYLAVSRFANVILDVPVVDGSVVYFQGDDPRLAHLNVWYSCHEIFVEDGDTEVLTDVLLLQTLLDAREIAPYWQSANQGVSQATIDDRAQLDALAERLDATIEVDTSGIDFADRASKIVRLVVDADGHLVDYYTYDLETLVAARSMPIYELWETHAPIVAARAEAGQLETADLMLEVFPDGRTQVVPWGAVYAADARALRPITSVRDRKVDASRREVLRDLLAIQLRQASLSIQERVRSFDRKRLYQVTLAKNGRVLDYIPLDNGAREQLNRTPLPYLERAQQDHEIGVEFLVQFKSSSTFQINDLPTE